jgi:outer membrane protein assembly factor BamB
MKFTLCLTHKKQTASFRMVGLMLAIAPLWLMLATANTSAHAQTQSSPGDWTQFHRDNMQRWNPYETVLGVNNVGNLQLKWKSPVDHLGLSSPAVVNGVVYFGSDLGSVHALNASTGAKLWSFATAGGVSSSPAVANGVVYVGSDGGNVYALNASTGAKLWSFDTGGDQQASPAVVNGVVYVGSGIGIVYALNASSGAKLWSFDNGADVFSSPAVANGVVYFGSQDTNVYALNASTGAELWSYPTGGVVDSSPAVANGVVYVGSVDGNLYALNANTGAKLWSFATGNVVASSPAVANGVVYVGAEIGTLYALNASTGVKLWSFDTGGPIVFPSPVVANGVVYVSSDGGNFALNASTGAKLWSYLEAPGFSDSSIPSPTIVDGVLYIFAQDPTTEAPSIYAFSVGADLFLRILPTPTTVHQGDLLTYAFPVWNLGPNNAVQEVLNTQVPAGTVFDYIRISGTPGLGTCTHTPYLGAGPIPIVCHENGAMALNTTWTVRLTVKVTAPAGTVITESAATMADTPDPNMANNTATVSLTVVP